jgi:hypothetical protein
MLSNLLNSKTHAEIESLKLEIDLKKHQVGNSEFALFVHKSIFILSQFAGHSHTS